MTVQQLIEVLQKFPGNLPVLIPGYELDWDPIGAIEQAHMQAQPMVADPMSDQLQPCPSYLGLFRRAEQDPTAVRAVLLCNLRRDGGGKPTETRGGKCDWAQHQRSS